MENCEGKVGPFFYLGNTIVSDSIFYQDADLYGVCKTWSSHDSFWTELGKIHKEYRNVEYFIYPRGRVTYNSEKDIFYVFLNPILNTPEIVGKVIQEYNLICCQYLIDDRGICHGILEKGDF